ncbi:sushi domain-containing protein 1 isoform X2 [Salarias fasciatus]|uniref:sushi domain-containing protein 1 isoform X2 n=1 Tax=Salarias fasciatus TaxID=181472 RepID=UPI001176589F|nr:sushi domain-containing protein 1-like isoform X2 [Salarias fasciatus]
MDGRKTAVTVVFLLCVFTGKPAGGQSVLDVCASCHLNATCDDKADGSGKVCNCKYGFVGNGRTFCQDKDECQIGASKICGQHTTCHNTHGSYYCTCLAGYSPSNSMAIFIPNDGTHCRGASEDRPSSVTLSRSCQVFALDVDECRVSGVCGEGARCRNLDGSFDCSCQVGYRVHDGVEPFHPARDNASCKVVDCGQPVPVEDAVLQALNGTTFGGEAWFVCDDGFVWRRGDNRSVCGADGLWTRPTMVCEEVSCGAPPVLPHAGQQWDGRSTPGSTLTYSCQAGFYHSEGSNVSVCTVHGNWTKSDLSCKEVDCGEPSPVPNSVMLWDKSSSVGSEVVYQCVPGYLSVGEGNVSVCTAGGQWEGASLLCQEISCGPPVTLPNTNLRWDGSSSPGSAAQYECVDGFYQERGTNISTCSLSGEWGEVSVQCKAECGPFPVLAHSEVLWHNRSVAVHGCVDGYYRWGGSDVSECGSSGVWQEATLTCKAECGPFPVLAHSEVLWHNRSVAVHGCVEGYYRWGGSDVSECLGSGRWREATLTCKAECGPIPILAHSEVLWHNRSVVVHRCVEGYHSWRGSNVSECGSSGQWVEATLKCIETKPPITHLSVFNENCLRWNAEKYEEDTETYKVIYTGSRDYQRSFHDKRKRYVSSRAGQLELCLDLLPVTNYSVSVTAASTGFTASVAASTGLPEPPPPVVHYGEFENPLPTLRLRRSSSTLDPLSVYQVFVIPVEGIVAFDCSSPATSDPSEYVAAQLDLRHVGTEMNFTVGDGRLYGGFHNAPLESGTSYYIILRAVCQWKTEMKSSCVLWAKVRGTSYILRVSSLCGAVFVALATLSVLGGYGFIWCFKKT